MDRESDRMGGFLLILFGLLLFAAALAVAWATMFEHGTNCASGGGPASCTPKGGLASTASLIIGASLTALVCVPAYALFTSGMRRLRGSAVR